MSTSNRESVSQELNEHTDDRFFRELIDKSKGFLVGYRNVDFESQRDYSLFNPDIPIEIVRVITSCDGENSEFRIVSGFENLVFWFRKKGNLNENGDIAFPIVNDVTEEKLVEHNNYNFGVSPLRAITAHEYLDIVIGKNKTAANLREYKAASHIINSWESLLGNGENIKYSFLNALLEIRSQKDQNPDKFLYDHLKQSEGTTQKEHDSYISAVKVLLELIQGHSLSIDRLISTTVKLIRKKNPSIFQVIDREIYALTNQEDINYVLKKAYPDGISGNQEEIKEELLKIIFSRKFSDKRSYYVLTDKTHTWEDIKAYFQLKTNDKKSGLKRIQIQSELEKVYLEQFELEEDSLTGFERYVLKQFSNIENNIDLNALVALIRKANNLRVSLIQPLYDFESSNNNGLVSLGFDFDHPDLLSLINTDDSLWRARTVKEFKKNLDQVESAFRRAEKYILDFRLKNKIINICRIYQKNISTDQLEEYILLLRPLFRYNMDEDEFDKSLITYLLMSRDQINQLLSYI